MLRIKKLKKKKKDKKKKKENDSDLFDSEELEAYKKRQQLGQVNSGTEWKQFNDIDTALKRTQTDLDRIKSTSYFQKVVPKTVEREPEDSTDSTDGKQRQPVVVITKDDFQIAGNSSEIVTRADSETSVEAEDEKEDDIFDTSYVEAVNSGQFKLAYIPESPVESEEDGAFDPFDTSAAEAVILGPAASSSNTGN